MLRRLGDRKEAELVHDKQVHEKKLEKEAGLGHTGTCRPGKELGFILRALRMTVYFE